MPTIADSYANKNAISQNKDCLKTPGFRLTKFVLNTPEILAEIADNDKDKSKGIMRVLGQKWSVTTDDFVMFPLEQFPKDAAVTQRNYSVWYPQSLIFSACCVL